MNYIGKRIYFNKEDGSIILDTGERCGAVVPTTFEEDVEAYEQLQAFDQETLAYIDLGYGELKEDFSNCSRYYIDVETDELVFIFDE